MPSNPLIKFKTSPSDYYTPNREPGGGRKFFEENYSRELISRLVSSIENVIESYTDQFEEFPDVPGVFRVSLIDEAVAKSHRPDGLFINSECEVIGVNSLGELLVAASPFALELLANEIQSSTTKVGKANISTLKAIAPIGLPEKLNFKENSQTGNAKLRLFNYRNATDNRNANDSVLVLFANLGISSYERIEYHPGLFTYCLRNVDLPSLKRIGGFLAAQSIREFPSYKPIRSSNIITGDVGGSDIQPPHEGIEYPLVAVFDSGIDPNNTALRPWVTRQINYIPRGDRTHNFDHGTFVSGLVTSSRSLNNGDPRFPSCGSKILDIAGLHAQGISELDLITRLEDAIQQNPDVKVWNLSLGSDSCRADHQFSELAVFLDRLQQQHDINIVISAGNFTTLPLRGWPNDVLDNSDLISTPGESALAITVGSLAHTEVHNSRVRREEPSPFSRRGPGTGFISKPEVVHYGGNCDANGSVQQVGVISTIQNDKKAENLGTSFSTPIVSSILSNIRHRLGQWDNRIVAKALLIHSAILNGPVPNGIESRYKGFGVPLDVDDVLKTENFRATVIYEFSLVENMHFVKELSIPACLTTADGKTKGKFSLTVVYDPPLDPNFGAEYCRCNIEVSLGSASTTDFGNISVRSVVPPAPKNVRALYERSQVENGFKWSPVKVYQKQFPEGVNVNRWALRASLTSRKQYTTTSAVRCVAVLTIEDPDKILPVYRDFVSSTQAANIEFERMQEINRTRIR
nr:S8 family peptidase [Bdellovibrio sp. HAGR004]